MICWSCERAAGDGVTCAYCDALQPPDTGADYFVVLGVPRNYGLNLDDAEARFRDLSRRFHPDRFAKADAPARRASLQRSVQLNEAWRTIRDPVRRAEYILRQAGYEIGAEADASAAAGAGHKHTPGPGPGTTASASDPSARNRMLVPPALLGEILELREDLADARQAGDDARVQAMAAQMRERVDAALGRVMNGLCRIEPDGAVRAEIFEAVGRDLIAIRYFRRFLDEVAVHDEAIAAGADTATHV